LAGLVGFATDLKLVLLDDGLEPGLTAGLTVGLDDDGDDLPGELAFGA
jgi:hypothetical protein